MPKISEITKHGQEEMPFNCSSCQNVVAIDLYNLLKTCENIHCPICGTSGECLTKVENDHE